MPDQTQPARLFGGRFRELRILKQGQGIETLLASDLEVSDSTVVVKTARADAIPKAAWQRLENDARLLSAADRSGLGPRSFGRDGPLLYWAMPFLAGTTLRERLLRGPLSVAEALAVGEGLLSAFIDLHDVGVVHRDIKPANVVLDERSPITSATVADFGPSRSLRLDGSREAPMESAHYLSPEQAGLLERGVDGRSDLYSAGVVLFECLAGVPPFAARTLGELLRQHLTTPVPSLRARGVAVPRALDDLIQRLLRKDPRERYQTATAALTDLVAIRRALAMGDPDPALVVGRHDRRRTLTEPGLVGRVRELALLDRELDRARDGEGRLVLLEASSGGGKTRLLDELARRAGPRGAWVIRGHATEGEAQVPLRLFDGLVAALKEAAREQPATFAAVRARLGEKQQTVQKLFPDLAGLLEGTGEEPPGPAGHEEQRAFEALVALVDALGDENQPVLLLLDDAQWAPEQAMKWLGGWLRTASPRRKRHVLVVVAARSDELGLEHPLFRLGAEAQRIQIAPLSEEEVRGIAESMAGSLPPEALASVHDLAAGNPFLAVAVVQGLVEARALVGEEGGWRVDPRALAEVQSSRHAAGVLARRIDQLSPDCRRLLSLGALLGKRFDASFAASLAGLQLADALPLLDDASRRQILWLSPSGESGTFLHDRLRQAVLARLPEGERRALHLQIAEQLESRPQKPVFELAHHFDAAGEHARAFGYAVQAAKAARAKGDAEVAERYLRIAERGVPRDSGAARRELAESLAEVLMVRGRYAESAAALEVARGFAETPLARARLQYRIGELRYRTGDFPNAAIELERALELLGRTIPRRWPHILFAFIGQALLLVAQSLSPALRQRRRREDPAAGLLACSCYSLLTLTYFLHRSFLATLWAHLSELNLAERYPRTIELARAWSDHGIAMGQLPWFSRALSYTQRAVELCRELGDSWQLGCALQRRAFVLGWNGRLAETVETAKQALTLLERAGDRWEAEATQFCLATAWLRVGKHEKALEACRALRRSGRESGNLLARAYPLEIWSRIPGGQVPEQDCAEELLNARNNPQIAPVVLLADGLRLSSAGEHQAAVARLEQAELSLRRTGQRNDFVAHIPGWRATVLRRAAEQVPVHDPKTKSRLHKQARSAARRALRLARAFRCNLPHALRESGLLAAAEGKPVRARKLLDRALEIADGLQMLDEAGETLRARASLGLSLGWPGANSDAARADSLLASTRLPPPIAATARVGSAEATLSLVDRFDALLEEGRRLSAALSDDTVFEAARGAALALLRAEQVWLLAPAGGGEVAIVGRSEGPPPRLPSAALVAHVSAGGRPVVLSRDGSEAGAEFLEAAHLASALLAPIFQRGEARAVLLAVSRHAPFDAEAERLASFVATLAGSSLENADGFFRLREAELAVRESQREVRALHAAVASQHEEERRRLALALHDGAGQVLIAADLHLSELLKSKPGAAWPPAIDKVQTLLASLLQDLRGLSHDLRPAVLDYFGLPAALRELATTFDATALEVEVSLREVEGAVMSPDTTLGLYRIAQSALANVVRHAEARHCWISLATAPSLWILEIGDDGKGFDPFARHAGTGVGLLGLRERTTWLGGRCLIDSAPGRGTRVRIEVPRAQP